MAKNRVQIWADREFVDQLRLEGENLRKSLKLKKPISMVELTRMLKGKWNDEPIRFKMFR